MPPFDDAKQFCVEVPQNSSTATRFAHSVLLLLLLNIPQQTTTLAAVSRDGIGTLLLLLVLRQAIRRIFQPAESNCPSVTLLSADQAAAASTGDEHSKDLGPPPLTHYLSSFSASARIYDKALPILRVPVPVPRGIRRGYGRGSVCDKL